MLAVRNLAERNADPGADDAEKRAHMLGADQPVGLLHRNGGIGIFSVLFDDLDLAPGNLAAELLDRHRVAAIDAFRKRGVDALVWKHDAQFERPARLLLRLHGT